MGRESAGGSSSPFNPILNAKYYISTALMVKYTIAICENKENKSMDKPKHFIKLQLVLPFIGILILLFTLVYGKAGWPFITLGCAIILTFEYLFTFREYKSLNPYFLMILSPLLLLKYSSIVDFRIRIFCFILFVYIINAAYARCTRKIDLSLLKAKPAAVWLTAFVIFSLASTIITFKGIHLSGDEPHYIMIAQSIVDDGDFDLKNNIEEKTYFSYLPIELRFHGGEYNGKYRSFHLPGVSFLLIPFYWLFKALGLATLIPPPLYFRLAASFINAFFALCLFYLLKMKFPEKEITGFWLLFLSIFPLIFHAVHLYPELPAATLMMAAYLFTFSEKKNYLAAGLFLSFIPWFHVKYIPGLAVLAVAILYNLLKPFKPFHVDKEKIKGLFRFILFPIVSFFLLMIYSKILYGSLDPAGIFPKESYWSVPWLLRLKVFLAYFLDQRDGLLFYSPLFFLVFFSFKKRKELAGMYLLSAIAAAYIFFHAFTTVRGAYSPAGRPLMFVSWIFIILIAHYYFHIRKEENGFFSRFGFKALAGLSFFVPVWLFYYPLFVYQPVFAATQERASLFNLFHGSDFIYLWEFFPSFLTSPGTAHPANFGWLGLLAAALLFFYSKPLKIFKKPFFTRQAVIIPLLYLLFLVPFFYYCLYPHVHLIEENKYTSRILSFYNNSRNFRYLPERGGFKIKAGGNYDIFIDRETTRKDNVTFDFTFPPGDTANLTLRSGRRSLYRFVSGTGNRCSFSLRLSSLKLLRVNDRLVSHLGIETHTTQKNAFLWLEIH
jgi:hypothetical protein